MSVGTFLLPIRIETRALRGDEAQVVVAFGEQHFRDLLERNFRALVAILFRDRAERQAQERHAAVFFRKRVARKLEDSGQRQGWKALLIHVEPTAVLCRATLVPELARTSTQ